MLTEIVIFGLITWRISSLLVFEEGPADIFGKLRNFLGVKYDVFSKPYGENVVSKVFSCLWCMSMWVSMILCLSAYTNLWQLFLLTLSSSTVAILIDSFVGNSDANSN